MLLGIGMGLLALVAYKLLFSPVSPELRWDMINVNATNLQGDAHLLSIGDKTVLIDAGYYSEAKSHLVPFLQSAGVEKIDYFFISHPHRDHYEGALAIVEAGIPIVRLLYKEPARDVKDCCYSRSHFVSFMDKMVQYKVRTYQPKTGYKLELPHQSSLEILHAQEGNFPDKNVDVNDLSMVIRWQTGHHTVLFTGDLNKTVGAYLANDPRMKADMIKVPHHGGRSLVPNLFYDQVQPDLAFVSGPQWVWCGERGAQTRAWVEDNRVPTWVNGTDGHVSVLFKGAAVSITPRLPSHQCRSDTAPAAYPAYLN